MFALYILFALDMLNMSLFLPIFNKFVISLGGSHNSIGLIGSSGAFISLIWKPIAGNLSDTKGRKQIMLWCIALSFIGNILTYFSRSIFLLFFARAICAFGSPTQTLLRTTITDVIPDSNGTIMNKIGAILSICFMGGALLSGFLSEYPYGVNLVFLLISINLAVSFLITNILLEGRTKPGDKKQVVNSNIFENFQIIVKNVKHLQWSQYWEVFTIKGLLEFSYGLMQMNMGLVLLNHFNIDGRYMGYNFCLIGVVSILTNLVFLKLNSTYYKKDKGYIRILHGCTLLALSYLGLGTSSVYIIFLCFMTTMIISRTVLDSTLFELLNSKVNESEKGTIVSLFDGVLSLSELIAPIISSILVTFYGEQFTLLLCTIPTALGIVIAYLKKYDNIKINVD